MSISHQMIFKHELLRTATTLGLLSTSFQAVSITEWKPIMKRVEERFVAAPYDKMRWWWDGNFKGSVLAVVLTEHPFEILDKLIPLHEQVWFIAVESWGKDKFWLFEGDIEAIQRIIGESSAFEYYIVSKKYEWLLCENHHNVLYGVGDNIIEKLKRLENKLVAS